MKNLTKTILTVLGIGVLSCALFSQQAQAVPIQGSINFAGAVHLDNNNLALATTVGTWFDISGNAGFSNVAPGGTGDFAGIAAGTQATMTQWIFNPSTLTAGLWSVGGFTFDLLTATVVTQTANFLNILGTGIISGNGFDPTAATWSFTISNSDGLPHPIFAFGASASTLGQQVPDGGSAVALLGLALIGIDVLRRKLRTRE